MEKLYIKVAVLCMLCSLLVVFPSAAQSLQLLGSAKPVLNRGFEQVEKRKPEDEEIKDLLSKGWKFDHENYPWKWRLNPANPGTLEMVT